MQSSAASKGTLLTGGTLKALAGYGQGLADNTYGQTYDRSMQEYLNKFNIDRANKGDLFSRYYSLGQWGQANPGA